MSRALDNVNPTIFAPTASTSLRRTAKSAKALLWDESADGYSEVDFQDGSSGEESEDIDADEVFGMSAC